MQRHTPEKERKPTEEEGSPRKTHLYFTIYTHFISEFNQHSSSPFLWIYRQDYSYTTRTKATCSRACISERMRKRLNASNCSLQCSSSNAIELSSAPRFETRGITTGSLIFIARARDLKRLPTWRWYARASESFHVLRYLIEHLPSIVDYLLYRPAPTLADSNPK